MLRLKYAPDRDARTARLLRATPGQLRCWWVWQPVAGRQTDLLLGALREFPPDADWTPVVLASQAGRWTPAQRDQVRDLLSAQAGDPGIPAARRAKAAVSVSRIPGSGDRVLSWAASEEATVAEAALMACAERVQPSLLEALLGEALLGGGVKVTIRKQAARLLGKEALDVCLRRNRRAPQAFPGGSGR